MVVIALENGWKLAAFTSAPFVPQVESGQGMIVVLNTGKVYYPKELGKVIRYDAYEMVFGNSQLRIKTNDYTLYRNFGKANGLFDAQGDNLAALHGEGKDTREVTIKGYEIFEIRFKQKE